jgi:hypothetical protein
MSADEKAVDAEIVEFGSAREEVFARIESQRQSFNYLVTLSTAVLAFIGSALTPAGVRFDVRLVMFTPLLAAPLAFIFFDNELVIWTLGRYIREETENPRRSEIPGSPRLTALCPRATCLGPLRGQGDSQPGSSVVTAIPSCGRIMPRISTRTFDVTSKQNRSRPPGPINRPRRGLSM